MNSKSKKVKLSYYAFLRDKRGVDNETVQTTSLTAKQLYNELDSIYHFDLGDEAVKVSVNDAFMPWDTAIKDGDHVVFIPPVSGG